MNRTIVLGKDADDRERHSIEFNDLSENIRASVEFALPETVAYDRSEEHTSELQSQSNLVCRLLLEKKKTASNTRCGPPLQKGFRLARDGGTWLLRGRRGRDACRCPRRHGGVARRPSLMHQSSLVG